MSILTATQARANFYKLIESTSINHEPAFIKGKKHNAVLISEEDWKSMQETMYLLSVPGLYESILEGEKEPLEECEPYVF